MAWVRWAAEMARTNRQPVAEDNPGRTAERQVSEALTQTLEAYGRQRDALSEKLFQEVYALARRAGADRHCRRDRAAAPRPGRSPRP